MSLLGRKRGRPTTKIQLELIIKKFLVFVKRELNITHSFPIILIEDISFSTMHKSFGMIDPRDKVIHLSIINRHPIDILRTLAHEYVHLKQLMSGKIVDGSIGSLHENQANAKAGELLRKYGKLHPELFDLTPIR